MPAQYCNHQYRLKTKPRAWGESQRRRGRRWRKHSVCMTNALAGGIPSPQCRLRAENFAALGRRKERERTNKEHMVSVRLTEVERERLQQLCTISGLPVSAVLRQLISGVTIRQRPPKELHDLYAEINRIGTNINQIARKANAGFATKDDMRELLFLMKAIEQKMAKVAEQ